MKRTLQLAIDYVDRHLYTRYLFPVKPSKKYPPLIRDNLAQASSDPAQLEAWEKKWPGCNWGLSHKKSGVMVADVDTNEAKGKVGQRTYDALDLVYGWPATEETTTPSGGHHHIYEGWANDDHPAHIMALGVNGIGKDIDSPNYTLIPGCTFDDGTSYVGNDAEAVKCPQWIYATIKNSKAKARITDAGDIVVELDLQANIDLAIDFLKNDAEPAIEGSGGDFNTLKTAYYLKDIGISQELGASLLNEYYNPRCEPPWDFEDLIKKMGSAYNYANLSKVGGKTAAADFDDDPPEPITPMGNPKKIAKEKKERAKARETARKDPGAKTKDQIVDQWIWVASMKRWFNKVDPKGNNLDRDIWDVKSFDSKFNKYICPKRGSASDILLRLKMGGPASYYRVSFKPNEPQVLDAGQTFNVYREPDIKEAEGDITWWNEHLAYLFPEPEYRDHLLNWMGWLLQNRAEKPRHALVLQGPTNGTGKSFIGKVLTRILHPANVSIVPQSGLSGRFNSWALQCKLIVVEELRAVDRAAVKETLHDIITEDVISVEKKGVDVQKIENCFGIFAITNDDAAITLDNKDRRYLVIRTDAEQRAAAYYTMLFAKLKDPVAMAAVAYSLMTRDLKGYSGQQAAPMTAAKAEMLEAGRPDLEHELISRIDTLPKLFRIEDIIETLPRRLENKGMRLHSAIRSFLMSRGGIDLKQCPTPSGERPRLMALGPRAAMLAAQDKKTLGALYAKDRENVMKGLPVNDDADEEFGQPDD
jgi:hypothetical protein